MILRISYVWRVACSGGGNGGAVDALLSYNDHGVQTKS